MRTGGAVCLVAGDDLDAKIEEMKTARDRFNSGMIRMNTAKFFADGVLDTRTAYLLEPYSDNPDKFGEPGWEAGALKKAYARMNAEGFQIHTHSIGDAATRMVLDAYEYARDNVPAGDYRNTITHLQLVDPADIPRFRELNVIASTQPYWHMKEPGFWKEVEYAAVGDRAERAYPLGSLFRAGAIVTASSDSPVTVVPCPMYAIQIGVTRNLLLGKEVYGVDDITDVDDPVWLLGADERATVPEMIRAFTANGAYALFLDRETGTLEEGKLADLVVLDTNILECPPLEIHRAKVLRTYLGGKLVYEAGGE